MITFIYYIGQIEITINCLEEDYNWLHQLFLTDANPLKTLRNIELSYEQGKSQNSS